MRKSNTPAATTSLANMGKALVLMATSCAALSSGGGGGHSVSAGSRRGMTTSHHNHNRVVQRHGRTLATRAGRVHRPNTAWEFNSIVALHYRDGDEDQPPEARAANRAAVRGGLASGGKDIVATPTGSQVSPPNFLFTPITRMMMPSRQTPNASDPSSTRSDPSSKEEDERQLAMDDYLEYCERRYSRTHPRQQHSKQHAKQQHQAGSNPKWVVLDFHLPRKIFLSTLALHRSSNLKDAPRQQAAAAPSSGQPPQARTAAAAAVTNQAEDEEEDPLNALGLSNLASARLRQRLHVPRDLRDEHTLLTSSTTSAVNFLHHMVHLNDPYKNAAAATASKATGAAAADNSAVASSAAGKAVEETCGRCSSYIALSFPAQVKLLVTTMVRIVSAFANTVRILTAFGSRMFSEILDKGGFGHSLRMMSVASVAILLMFRPLFRGALKQG